MVAQNSRNAGKECLKIQKKNRYFLTESAAHTYPIRNSLSMMHDLRDLLNRTGWSLAALSKPYSETTHIDALDQFVAVVKQVKRNKHNARIC